MDDHARKSGAEGAPSARHYRAIADEDPKICGGIDSSWDIGIDYNIIYRDVGKISGSGSGANRNRTAHVFPGAAAIRRFKDVARWIVDTEAGVYKRKPRKGNIGGVSGGIGGIDSNGSDGTRRKASLPANADKGCIAIAGNS
jgi:hypothetical protein